MTATPELIIWVATNIIGIIVYLWLVLISWERKIGVVASKRALLRESRLNAVNRQLRYRITMAIFHIIATVIGTLAIFIIHLPYNSQSWIMILAVVMLVTVATIDLIGEFRS